MSGPPPGFNAGVSMLPDNPSAGPIAPMLGGARKLQHGGDLSDEDEAILKQYELHKEGKLAGDFSEDFKKQFLAQIKDAECDWSKATLSSKCDAIVQVTRALIHKKIQRANQSSVASLPSGFSDLVTGASKRFSNAVVGAAKNFAITVNPSDVSVRDTSGVISAAAQPVDVSGAPIVVSGAEVVIDVSGTPIDISGASLDISGAEVSVDVSGTPIDISGASLDISGAEVSVDVSGTPVDVSGTPIDISGASLDISGAEVSVDVSGNPQTGTNVVQYKKMAVNMVEKHKQERAAREAARAASGVNTLQASIPIQPSNSGQVGGKTRKRKSSKKIKQARRTAKKVSKYGKRIGRKTRKNKQRR